MLKKVDLSVYNSYILGLYGLFICLSTAISSFLTYLMLIVFLVDGNFKEKFFLIKNNYFIYAMCLFLGIHLVWLIGTDDFTTALMTLKREWKLIFVALFMMIARKEHIDYYIKCFIIGMTISELVSYAIWFQIIPPFMNATLEMPSPFLNHVFYNVFLAVAIYLLTHIWIHNKTIEKNKKILILFFIFTMTVNMFITGGRTGQIAFLIMMSILSFSLLKSHFKIALGVISGLFISCILAYFTIDIFYQRVNLAYNEIIYFEENHHNSVGYRIALTINSLEIIKENLLFGVGTGDWLDEYKKINTESEFQTIEFFQPHNMYILVASQFGLIGLIIFLSIFYFQLKIAYQIKDQWRNFRFAFLTMLLVSMLSNSYLYKRPVTVLYLFFSAFLFQVPNKKTPIDEVIIPKIQS